MNRAKKPTNAALQHMLEAERNLCRYLMNKEEERSNVVQILDRVLDSQITTLQAVKSMLRHIDVRVRNYDDDVPF
jgi:hypothetical protein